MARNGRLHLAVLFGGRSAEHEVSLSSARFVLENLDSGRFEVVPVGITQEGLWLEPADSAALLEGRPFPASGGEPGLPPRTDCVFPVLHGPFGEDGRIQGWLEMQGVPYVGSGWSASALAMDKALTKRVLRDAGIPVLSWSDVDAGEFEADPGAVVRRVISERGLPCFVKPACLGSSVGITRVAEKEGESGVAAALGEAFRHGRHALVESALDARELEIAVLEGQPPVVTEPGEIRPGDWYDYKAKYLDHSAELIIPAADLKPRMAANLQEMALRSFQVLRLGGMARVDFFQSRKDGRPLLNEVNTIPGFTGISMYRKLMEHHGIPPRELFNRLVDLAMNHAEAQAPAGTGAA